MPVISNCVHHVRLHAADTKVPSLLGIVVVDKAACVSGCKGQFKCFHSCRHILNVCLLAETLAETLVCLVVALQLCCSSAS